MVKLWFFHFRVTNSRLKNKKVKLRVTNSVVKRFISSPSSYQREVDKWKKFVKCYSLNVRERLEIYTTPEISENLVYSMSSGCPGMLKCSEIIAFLAVFVDTLPWTFANP